MSGIIISKTTAGLENGEFARIGKFATPLKAYLRKESDRAEAEGGPAKWLCTMDTSNTFAESSVATARAAGLIMTEDGDRFPLTGEKEVDPSTIYMYAYSREAVILHSTLQDAVRGPSAEMRYQVRSLSDDYYTTRNDLATLMMANGTKTYAYYTGADGKKAKIPLPAPNNHPLFFKAHEVGGDGDTQSNIFYHQRGAGVDIDEAYMSSAMAWASHRLANIKGNNGRANGYYANVLVIPGNNYKVLEMARKVAGSPSSSNADGASSNYINIHYGNWDIVPLLDWRIPEDSKSLPMIFMSSVAREKLRGNMMYTREPCTVRDEINFGTRNYCWNAYARLGIGHHTYMHALYFESLANGTTALSDGQGAAAAATRVTL